MRLIIPILLTASAALTAVWWPWEPAREPQTIESPVLLEPVSANAQSQAFLLPVVQPAHAPVRDTVITEPSPDANAAAIYHPETDTTLFAKNETVRVPIASVTKILTAMTINDLLMLDDVVTISSRSIQVDGEKQTLFFDEQLSVNDLLTLMLVESSNDAAYALTEYASVSGYDLVAEMNEKAKDIGMGDSLFTDPAGLDDSAYSTARDLIRMVRAAMKVPHLWTLMRHTEVTVTSIDGAFVHEIQNTNQLLGVIDGISWGKTGYTDGALGCMLLIMEIPSKSDTLVSVVLGSRARFADTRLLIDWAEQAWRWSR